MALINCSECGAQVSDKAAACPQCGAPPAAAAKIGSEGGVVTTQQTGKGWKIAQAIAACLMIAGVTSCSLQNYPASAMLWMLGVMLWLGARIGAWWKHG